MATYPTPPGPRIAWGDPDFGASAQWTDSNHSALISELSATDMAEAAGNSLVSNDINAFGVVVLLPEAYDLSGVFGNRVTSGALEVSTDTTTGIDGTWNSTSTGADATANPTAPLLRSGIGTGTWNGVVGVRMDVQFGILRALHLYGVQSTPHGLKLWDDTLDQAFDHADLDTEDTADTDVNDITFRVKNLDGAQKTNVTLTLEEREPIAGFDDMHQIDTGSGFGSFPANIGSLADGAISSAITVRQTIDDTELGVGWARLKVDAD